MDNRLIDRIFEDIDKNTERSESLSNRIGELSVIVYSQATSLGIVTKLVVAIILFLIISSLTIIIKETRYQALEDSSKIMYSIPYNEYQQNITKGVKR